ncbi:E3 ubiquitin-protein ligase RNF103 isoform X1 [Mus musculus]|uniref:E3 ubiquitin-protein ligase RNF103 isoform X1 n=1 Tax=Mus musculus TaxID=10090 RepID=UPI001677FA65|nr:E3 ubiquitin-protein ligase RNF103 isoform X1 [Mus musculus]
MWLKLFFLLLYFLVLFVLARFFEAIVWYETGIFATQLVDPVALSFKKLKTILECRGLGYSGLPEKKDVRELVEKSGDLMEGELYSALKEEEASESVSSTNFSGEMHFYELVEDTKDGIWLVQVIANDRSPLVGKIHWEKMVKKVSRFGIRTGTFNCSSDPRGDKCDIKNLLGTKRSRVTDLVHKCTQVVIIIMLFSFTPSVN